MTDRPKPESTNAIPGLVRGSELASSGESSDTDRVRRIFRDNFHRQLRQSGLSIQQLSEQAEVDIPTLKRWMRTGVVRPEHRHIAAVARVFGLADPWSLLKESEGNPAAESVSDVVRADADSASLPPTVDRAANPMIEEVRRDRPDLFDAFSPEDWTELYSNRGVGGSLSYDGVLHVAERINAKREIRRKFEVILETQHFRTLANLVEVLYRDVNLR